MNADHSDERARPTAPAWATVPTTTWQPVGTAEDEDDPHRPRQGGGPGRPDPNVPHTPTPAPPGAGRATVPQQRSGQHPPQGAPVPPPPGPPPGQYPPGQRGPVPPQYGPPGQPPQGQYPPGQHPPGRGPQQGGPDPRYADPRGQVPPGHDPRGQAPHQPGRGAGPAAPQAYAGPRGPQQAPGTYPPGAPPRGPVGQPGYPQGPGPQGGQHGPGGPGGPGRGNNHAGPGGVIPPWAGPTPQPGESYAGPQRPAGTRPPGAVYGSPAPADAPVSAVPVSAAPVSAAPVSVAPVSAVPVSVAPVSAVPVSATPVSAPASEEAVVVDAPASGAPVSAAPAADSPEAATPTSGAPVSGSATAESAEEEPGTPASPDPEQILARFEWVFDPDTLHEVCEDPDGLSEVRDMLTSKINNVSDNAARARLLSLRAVVSRILGDLSKAIADAKLGLAHAEATGELRRIAIAQARLAHVLQWRGEYEEADRLFAEANSPELPDRLRGTMHQHAGKSAYEQGRYIEACNHFEKALELRKEEDPELMAATEIALDAVFRRVAENGWGPYPRTRDEILQIHKPPVPALDEATGLWGFTDAEGETAVQAVYADIQPFRDGAAWVRRPEFEPWELIDETGSTLIPATSGYLGVSSFTGGLAWVSRDGNGAWIAIDKANTVTISTGFDDVRPFRRGLAAVRRNGRWGAVDGVGRVVVPLSFDQFATALSDGRYIDGFSDEGLAVVQVGGRKGIVDRGGRMVVEPVFSSLVIHPVAFLMTDDSARWGALDRKGRILIDPSHPSRISVTMEIDRLLADARPVL